MLYLFGLTIPLVLYYIVQTVLICLLNKIVCFIFLILTNNCGIVRYICDGSSFTGHIIMLLLVGFIFALVWRSC